MANAKTQTAEKKNVANALGEDKPASPMATIPNQTAMTRIGVFGCPKINENASG